MSAVKKKENTQEIREIVTIFKALDPMSKLLLQNSAKTLLMRDQMTQQDKKQLVQQWGEEVNRIWNISRNFTHVQVAEEQSAGEKRIFHLPEVRQSIMREEQATEFYW